MGKRREIFHLLTVIGVLCCSIGIIHRGKRYELQAEPLPARTEETSEELAYLSPEQAYLYIQPIIITHNIYLLVQKIGQLTLEQTKALLSVIIKDLRSPLTQEEKVTIILGCVELRKLRVEKYDLLSLFTTFSTLALGIPPLFVASISSYPKTVVTLVGWVQEQRVDAPAEKYAQLRKTFIDDGIRYAITENNIEALKKMLQYKVPLDKEKASELLWYVVSVQGRDNNFVSLLVTDAGADVNYAYNGRTLLMKAVENNDKAMVAKLLENGADVSLIINPAVGSALQLAIEHHFVTVELLLRKYGARE
ncbi:MAG TPA: ankyrin repeat domain-containing protein [Candidatus Bathyarchaeia archaeon]|nr:ankyrin repeat domain-containing protein [Candidatus Bathyarchaeia archaeon]